TGTVQRPRVGLTLPAGTAGETLGARLRDTMGFDVDPETSRCVAPAPTWSTLHLLEAAGFVLDAFEFPEALASLQRPLVLDAGRGRIEVYPRLADRDDVAFDLGEEAVFDVDEGCFRAPASAVADWPDHL